MLDMSFFLFLALVAPLVDLWFYPRLQRATAAGKPGVRTRYHLIVSASLWLLAGIAISLAMRRHLPWSDFRLAVASPLRLAAGLGFVILYLAIALRQRSALLANPERLQRLMLKHATSDALLPHTPTELRSFHVLSLSAGVCEEIVYRGFMLWFAATWIGLWPALLLTSFLFGMAHIYLGKRHVVRAAIAGVFLGLVAVGSASLWPAIAIHALADILSGDLGYRALRSEPFEQVRDERLRETVGDGVDGAALLVE